MCTGDCHLIGQKAVHPLRLVKLRPLMSLTGVIQIDFVVDPRLSYIHVIHDYTQRQSEGAALCDDRRYFVVGQAKHVWFLLQCTKVATNSQWTHGKA